jgi:Protein of unknown function (DUF2000)
METYEVQVGAGREVHGYTPDEMSTGEAGCSILGASSLELAAIRQQAIDRRLLAADMPAAAQSTRVYDDYLRELAKTHPDGLGLLAVSLIGPRNQVAKLVRHLELLP